MANPRKPRKGSMAYWPHRKAKKAYPRVRGWSTHKTEKPTLLGFAGYKAGMTHVIALDTKKTSLTKNEEIMLPVTIIECPPMRIVAARFYKNSAYGSAVAQDIYFKPTKELARKMDVAEKHSEVSELDKIDANAYSDIAVLACTQPVMSGLGKKTPEVFELHLSGSNAEKLAFIKENASQDITVDKIFKEAQTIDTHAVTKGRGLQGPVKRFRIGLKPHKSEKGRRAPGSRGGWSAQQHVMYRTAYSGQMGYNQRLQYNAQILKIGVKPEEVNPVDGFPHYGKVKSTYVLVRGSVPGPKKRMIMLTHAARPGKDEPLPSITHISLQSKQGR